MIRQYITELEQQLNRQKMLRFLGYSKTGLAKFLAEFQWKKKMKYLAEQADFSADGLLKLLRPMMECFAEEPQEGWLSRIFDEIRAELYPENFQSCETEAEQRARIFFLIHYRELLKLEQHITGFIPVDHLNLLPEEKTEACVTAEEYERFRTFWNDHYLFEFMRLGREVTPFNTVGHIGGVHHVATFVGMQLCDTEIPIDLALVSGAAAGHDLGKYGCSPQESKRIPYLHYYYTDELLSREKLPMIAHIASNHSTWDLELENLSIESLLLIYADFRVKSSREDGVEIVHFYTLEEAFDVILNKLDNVDVAKKHRYERVYAKLLDFENYLKDLGVETDIAMSPSDTVGQHRRDTALMAGDEVVEHLKYSAIEHNISIMSIFNNEAAFSSMLEAARSERQWKSQRAYLNILSEYFTYMTQAEKLMTVHFLYELLSHREGDIRRQAGALLGTIIANYDDVYRKELPASVDPSQQEEALLLWDEYLNKIVFPDYRVTDQHRSWIGYTLKIVLQGLLKNCREEAADDLIQIYFNLFREKNLPDSAVFVMLDSVITVPASMFREAEMCLVLEFAAEVSTRDSIEIKIGTLRVAEFISQGYYSDVAESFIRQILRNLADVNKNSSLLFLISKVMHNIGDVEMSEICYKKVLQNTDGEIFEEEALSDLFRDNLKIDTPWVVKIVNIEFLLEHMSRTGLYNQIFYLATHLSNLVKVSERVTVRHAAGKGLIRIADRLPMEQINEIVIELTKGLEIGEYQFSKYIPTYLGELALYLYPRELDEFISNLSELIENTNDRIGSVALDTMGEVISRYSSYRYQSQECEAHYRKRLQKMLGMLLKGLANYHEVVSQEAFMVIGQMIFGNETLSQKEKFYVFRQIDKKLLTLIPDIQDYDMNFFNNAAALNHIYRFISGYIFEYGAMKLPVNRQVAFFPGTFDPFSLSHKGIVQAIRDEGFEVYLALDEFSWSKKTQPRMIRRKIITMSVADEPNVFLFPDDLPVNIANASDLRQLKALLPDKELYMVVGSDVITNASSYRAEPTKDSIHSLNHIVFRRETLETGKADEQRLEEICANMTGKIRHLTLPVYLEDISSTRIRENIDRGRDISNLIDPVAQNYIYDNSLYLREPQYKNVLETRNITFDTLRYRSSSVLKDIQEHMQAQGLDLAAIQSYIDRASVRVAVIKDAQQRVCALAAVNELETGKLYEEFRDAEIAAYLRAKATGRIIVIRGIYCNNKADMRNLVQLMMTEVLAEAAAGDITYAIYHPLEEKPSHDIIDVLMRQGFTEISLQGMPQGIYEVNMKEPIAVIENMDTVIKDPFNMSSRVLDVLEETHAELQRALTKLNPGNLVLSFNAGVMNQKIVDMVTQANQVPNYPLVPRQLGKCMCVPFGKIMRGIAVPNTVTKTLHTEKMFTSRLDGFSIEEYPMYATIQDQIRTIKSFNRPVILVDDLLHKGYRMKTLDPIFKENDVEIHKLITGLLSGRGKDLMTIQGREVESAYFIPNLKSWFVESSLIPYIGGDGIQTEEKTEYNLLPSINLILPFAAPKFLRDVSREAVYDLSMVCLQNAEKIFEVLEMEYQNLFERKLTIKRLSDVIKSPRMPNGAARVAVDFTLSPSLYMADYMERLIRLEGALK